jgi:hypothetical protein
MSKTLLSLFAVWLVWQAPARSLPAVQAQQPQTATPATKAVPVATTDFAKLIERLSDGGGYFDSDNLISNEASFQHVMGALRKRKVTGGVYIGVGPDTGFTYIAQIRPQMALMTDIRRDNLIQHFWFKALFGLSRNRAEYLCLIFGKPIPADIADWKTKTIAEIHSYLDKTPKQLELLTATQKLIQARVKAFGLPLTEKDTAHLASIHQQFYDAGLDLKFTSKGRGSRYYYPSYRTLMLEKDLTGKPCNYLVNEDDFQYVKALEDKDLIIPVVGDLSGNKALPAIGALLKERNLTVSALYTSNVEFYLMRGYNSSFEPFAKGVSALPHDANSVIIRSYFNGSWGGEHPQTVSGYYSTQLLQTMDNFAKEFAAGGFQSYEDLVTKHLIELR